MRFIQSTYLASERRDVTALYSDMLVATPDEYRGKVVECYVQDLMRHRGLAGVFVRFFRWWRGEAGVRFYLQRVHGDIPEADHAAWLGMAHHLFNGQDTEDLYSAGGWSQREINLFLQIMRGY